MEWMRCTLALHLGLDWTIFLVNAGDMDLINRFDEVIELDQ